MRLRAAVLVALGACGGCGAAPPRECATATEPPSDATPCAIAGDGEPFLGEYGMTFPLFADRAGSDVIAVVHRPGSVRVAWSGLPTPGAEARAHVAIGGRGLRIDAWSDVKTRAFTLRARADVRPGHVWLRASSPVRIDGARGSAVWVQPIEDEGWVPSTLRAVVRCEDLAYTPQRLPDASDAAPVTTTRGYPPHAGDAIHVYDAPHGCVALTLGTQLGVPLFVLGARDGWTHVAGGARLAFDGWAPPGEVTTTPVRYDWGIGTIADDYDQCPNRAAVSADTDVRVGPTPDAPVRFVAERGVHVDALDAHGDFVAFDLPGRSIVAPDGARFWIARSALVAAEPPDGPGVDDDGCP